MDHTTALGLWAIGLAALGVTLIYGFALRPALGAPTLLSSERRQGVALLGYLALIDACVLHVIITLESASL